MMCLKCSGLGKVRDNETIDNRYQFKKQLCSECQGSGEKPLHMTLDQLTHEANARVLIYCDAEDCDYSLASDTAIKNFFRLFMDGGYVSYEGGGLESRCPLCGGSLVIEPAD